MPGADLACSGFGGSKLAISRRPLDCRAITPLDRKSTRLNSSHVSISYAVFCSKKKKFLSRYDDVDANGVGIYAISVDSVFSHQSFAKDLGGLPYDLIGNFFFFNDTETTDIYTLSLHDALTI